MPDGTGDSPSKTRLWSAALLGLLALVHAPMFAGQVVFTRDASWWTWPARVIVGAALRAGRLPLWNRWEGLGFPVLADPLNGVFYPGNALAFFGPAAFTVTLTFWLHTALGAFGTQRLAARLGASPAGALVAGLAWSLAGVTHSEWSSGIRVLAHAWIPWSGVVAWDLARACAGSSRLPLRAAVLAALPTAAALLVGEFFVALMVAFFGVELFALSLATSAPSNLSRAPLARRVALVAALVATLAALLGAPAVTAALGAVSATQRAAPLDASIAERWSLHPLRLVDFVVVGGFSLNRVMTRHPWYVPVLGEWPLLQSVYAGAAAVALSLVGARRDRRTAGLVAALAIGVFLAFGRHTPVHALARALAPPLRFMRSPEKYLALAVPPLALLAGLGADRLLTARDRSSWRTLALAVPLAAVVVLGASLLPPFMASTMRTGAMQSLLALGGVALAAALARSRPRVAAAVLALTVAADLANALNLLVRYEPMEHARYVPPVVGTLNREFGPMRSPAPVRVYRASTVDEALDTATDVPVELRRHATLQPKLNALHGIAVLPGYDVATNPEIDALLESKRVDVLRLMAVDAVMMPLRERAPRGLVALSPVAGSVHLYAVSNSLPRVYAAGQSVAAVDSVARAHVLDPEVVEGRRALLADRAESGGEPVRAGTCALLRVDDGLMEARCQMDRAGWVVFVEQYAAGWRATVDGRPAQVSRANLVMNAVRTGAGAHTVTLRYEAPGVRGGLALAALGVVLAAFAWRRREG